MPTITIEIEAHDLELIRRALEKELMFVDWLLKRTINDQRASSAAELTIEVSDLRRLRAALEPTLLRQPAQPQPVQPARGGRVGRLKAGGS